MASVEELCARLCLLTRAAWDESLPAPLTRPMMHQLLACGAIEGLVLRERAQIGSDILSRARQLLARSADVYACLNAYRAQGYEILLPQDARWPQRLKRLGRQMPQFLFVRGDVQLLARRAAAVAGSREIERSTQLLAGRIGAQLAREGIAMVCGGARGVDTLAQDALLDAGGELILVPAMPVQTLMRQPKLTRALEEGRLLIACDALPDAPFSAAKALTRNHTIYALGEAALVVAARDGVGGSWRGASDCLRAGAVPVFALEDASADMAGCRALLALGAKPLDCGRPLADQLFAQPPVQQMNLF